MAINIRATLGGMFGWMVDVFDLTLVLFIASVLGKAFFPPTNPIAQILFVFASYSLTLLARPLGGILFGHVADKVGRRITMMVTLLGLGISSALTGALPTYAEVGLLATALFVLLRLVVGLFVGGEVSGSHLIAVESSSAKYRGLISGVIESGYYWGYALAALTFALLSQYFGAAFVTVGWRYAFLVGLAVALVGILLRLAVDEPSIYTAVKSAGRVPRVPIAAFFKERARDALIALLLLAGIFWVAYATLGFLPTYLTNFLGVPKSVAYWGLAYASLIGGALTIIGGVASDWLRRKWAYIAYSALGIALAYPLTIALGAGFAALVASAGVLISVIGTGGVMLAYLAELFPTRYRGSAIGFLWNMASIGATAALLTAPFWLEGFGAVAGYALMLVAGYAVAIIGALITKDNTGIELSAD
ncbi:MAG: MFS transporter [Thermoproteus sp. AZ2]|jgi:MFS family permease|uniref:MFS transporter n=1 Tax=Thermoproteus sp. AZ2 TaxID=1609232 RepID=A0ACC6V3G5_9CREN|nr:MAG: MFS transporter [Vulcanisaeta sp. AZ3]